MRKGTQVRCRITNPTDAHLNGIVGVVTKTVKPGQLIPVRLPGQTVLWKFFPEELTVLPTDAPVRARTVSTKGN